MIHEIFPVGPLQCNCSVIGDESTHEAIVIDPGDDIDTVVAALAKHKLMVKQIVITPDCQLGDRRSARASPLNPPGGFASWTSSKGIAFAICPLVLEPEGANADLQRSRSAPLVPAPK